MNECTKCFKANANHNEFHERLKYLNREAIRWLTKIHMSNFSTVAGLRLKCNNLRYFYIRQNWKCWCKNAKLYVFFFKFFSNIYYPLNSTWIRKNGIVRSMLPIGTRKSVKYCFWFSTERKISKSIADWVHMQSKD